MRILAFSFLFFTYGLFAQVDSSGQKQSRIKERFKSLQLTTEQEEKIKAIYLNKRELLKKRKEENRLFYQNLEKKTQEDISQILTPEQLAEYNKIKEERKQTRKNQRVKRRFK
jgi:Spy/CpxP family protein refolding chaperone